MLRLPAAALMLLAAQPALAIGDPAAGRAKARACAACHGIDGVARTADAPNIGGEHALYLQNQLRNFRSGQRTHAVMSVVAAGLSDDDIDDLSAWYASIRFTVEVPPR